MQDILYEYRLPPTTWVYISSLMTIGIFFKFRRLWSVRNLDLIGLLMFAPGLLLVAHGQEQEAYVWLFALSGFFLVRLLLDPLMVRRPLLEPNLSAGGLTFTMVSLLLFLMTNVGTGRLTESDVDGVRRLEKILARRAVPADEQGQTLHGPGYPLFYLFANISNRVLVDDSADAPDQVRQARLEATSARTTAILAHMALVAGLVLIGYRHFDNVQTGVAVATLYLLLPYTAQMTSRVDHVVPAAILVWAVAAYRRPIVAGILLGLAGGAIYYPLFLLPLWCGFYWFRGLVRFLLGVASAILLLVVILAVASSDWHAFGVQLQQMFNFPGLTMHDLDGFWEFHPSAFRIPVLVGFLALCGGLALWPAQKNLGTLLSLSAAIMLGTQFWHGHQGGIYMAWYLPLLLLTVFRPNLEDRVALTALADVRLRMPVFLRRIPWRRALPPWRRTE